MTLKFIGDDFDSSKRGELKSFLKAYESEVFYSNDGKDFVDQLFNEVKGSYSEHIIQEEEFPETAFISFHGANRRAAAQLASHLREDGIKVWLDQRVLKTGDRVDETIVKGIAKCRAFIPLISQESSQIQNGADQGLKYHIREWEWALSRNLSGENPKVILPVKIDGTDWLYPAFANIVFGRIPGGNREGDYDKLKNRLLEIQRGTG
ncbi:MAG: toll/interleukin-1 receptor domain-containing protein [bacterium]|nr:toll/interleukin-1 receptor domain-containing protein [bacterium]